MIAIPKGKRRLKWMNSCMFKVDPRAYMTRAGERRKVFSREKCLSASLFSSGSLFGYAAHAIPTQEIRKILNMAMKAVKNTDRIEFILTDGRSAVEMRRLCYEQVGLLCHAYHMMG